MTYHLATPKEIDDALERYLSSRRAALCVSRSATDLYESLRGYVLRPGKRLRPLLVLCGHDAACTPGNEERREGLIHAAIAVELLHAFMLVHDDIVDQSDTRRGLPSLHRVYEDRYFSNFDGVHLGANLSLVAGDVLFALSIQCLNEAPVRPERRQRALTAFLETAVATGTGQMLDILHGVRRLDEVDEENALLANHLKTARYSFQAPLVIGAILAGATAELESALARFGLLVGEAYQLQDDILGLFGQEDVTGKSARSDLYEAKKTLLIIRADKRLGPRDRALLRSSLGRKSLSTMELERVQRLVRESGALEETRELVRAKTEEALAVLDATPFNEGPKVTLGQLVALLKSRVA